MRGNLLHPRKQFVQIIIAAVADIPRQGVIYFGAVVLQLGCQNSRYGQRGVAVGGAHADAPVLRHVYTARADVVERVHHFHRLRVSDLSIDHAGMRLAEGGEMAFIRLGAAEELVFAAA